MGFVWNAVYTRGQCTVSQLTCLAAGYRPAESHVLQGYCESAYFENLCLDTGLLPGATVFK